MFVYKTEEKVHAIYIYIYCRKCMSLLDAEKMPTEERFDIVYFK